MSASGRPGPRISGSTTSPGGLVILELPRNTPTATMVRSTLLLSSMQTLRIAGLFDAYTKHLAPADHAALIELAAPSWLPIHLAMAHYRACDALGLTEEQIIDLGKRVSQQVQGSMLATMARLAAGSVSSPETIFSQLDKMWVRAFQGGGVAVWKIGPKDMRVDVVGVPCTRYTYFRVGLRGIAQEMMRIFSRVAFVKELPRVSSAERPVFIVSWT